MSRRKLPSAWLARGVSMIAKLPFENLLIIPAGITSLARFVRWVGSEEFPEEGRIDFIDGQIEVDMSPEELINHNTPKTEIGGVLWRRMKESQFGRLFSDRARISVRKARLSCEPDLCVVSFDRLKSGAVKLTTATSKSGVGARIIIQGAPDLVAEIVSDSSVTKDTQRLPAAYFAAGVREYWLVDARGETLTFQIQRRGKSGFQAVRAAADGFVPSAVLGRKYRLSRHRGPDGDWLYDLDKK
jgi:Uma2 family endonuclease